VTRRAVRFLSVVCLLGAAGASFASGWRVAVHDGVWWFKRADGTRFLSRGVDCLGPGVEAKEFQAGRPEYSFALRRRESYADWQARTLKRLDLWGFNTVAGWSYSGVEKAGWPYTPVLHLGIQAGAPWVDHWDPDFARKIRKLAVDLTATYRGDPNLVGYFLDNEFGWGDEWLLGIALGWGSEAPGKHKVVATLKGLYRNDWKAFLRDFETTAKNWDGLLTATATGTRPGRGHRVIDAWTFETARKYFEVCAGVLREIDPGCLVLGDRYRQFYPQAVARAARGALDAVSTNYEAKTTDGWVSPCYFQTLYELSGCPVVVGEFYATARQNRSGNRNHGGEFTLVDTQVQRGQAAAAQVRQLAGFPFVVGWHWFQWCDEPTYGRGDGEDYNMGLVDIHDEPYADFLAALVPAEREAERVHAAARPPAMPDHTVGVPRQAGLVADGKLGDWDKSAPVPRDLVQTETPLLPFGDIFLGWDDANLWIAVRAYDFTIAGRGKPLAWDPATWGELHRLGVRVDDWKCRAATGLVASGKKDDEGRPVLFAVPPAQGQWSGAVASFIDQWFYVWELAIPAEALGGTIAPGRKFKLSLTVENRGDYEKMWLDGVEIEIAGRPAAAAPEPAYWSPVDTIPPPRTVRPRAVYPPPVRVEEPLPPGRRRVEPAQPGSVSPETPVDAGNPPNTPVNAEKPPQKDRKPRKPATPGEKTPVSTTPPAEPSPSQEPAPAPEPEPSPDRGRPERDRHRPEKPATPETTSPVPETRTVPGHPPAENPGNGKAEGE